jgi:ubiquinone/menaquinone biosynthesis C-methylase UbiE
MNNNLTDQGAVEKVEYVQHFFDQPKNYLARNSFDIRVRAETTEALVRDRKVTTVLDVGCGDGSVSLPLLSAQSHITLLDISPNMLAVAKSRVGDALAANVDFMNADFLATPFARGSYDLVICIGVLAHVSSPGDVIEKIATVLKPGGTLILQCTDSAHWYRRLVSLYTGTLALFRRSLYRAGSLTNKDVLDMTAKCGFRTEGVFCYGWPPPGFHRIFSQATLYRMVRGIFGDVVHNRNPWLGSEYIYALTRD